MDRRPTVLCFLKLLLYITVRSAGQQEFNIWFGMINSVKLAYSLNELGSAVFFTLVQSIKDTYDVSSIRISSNVTKGVPQAAE